MAMDLSLNQSKYNTVYNLSKKFKPWITNKNLIYPKHSANNRTFEIINSLCKGW